MSTFCISAISGTITFVIFYFIGAYIGDMIHRAQIDKTRHPSDD
jgi:hypothetical protein